MQDWLGNETDPLPKSETEIPIQRYSKNGIPIITTQTKPSHRERTSSQLSLTEEYYPIIATLKEYMIEEMNAIGDKNLDREVKLLDKIITSKK